MQGPPLLFWTAMSLSLGACDPEGLHTRCIRPEDKDHVHEGDVDLDSLKTPSDRYHQYLCGLTRVEGNLLLRGVALDHFSGLREVEGTLALTSTDEVDLSDLVSLTRVSQMLVLFHVFEFENDAPPPSAEAVFPNEVTVGGVQASGDLAALGPIHVVGQDEPDVPSLYLESDTLTTLDGLTFDPDLVLPELFLHELPALRDVSALSNTRWDSLYLGPTDLCREDIQRLSQRGPPPSRLEDRLANARPCGEGEPTLDP